MFSYADGHGDLYAKNEHVNPTPDQRKAMPAAVALLKANPKKA
jgi:hypothetical protein